MAGKLGALRARLLEIWRREPWYRFPLVVARRVGVQVGHRLAVGTVQRLAVAGYHLRRRLLPQRVPGPEGLPVRREQPPFFWTQAEADAVARRLAQTAPDYVRAVLAWADAARAHRFCFFGETFDHGERIRWRTDPRSGREWPLRFHNDLFPVTNLADESDVKVPYELSRFHHGVALGLAYRLTGETSYAAAFVEQFRAWDADNPYGLGVNWTCAMDVGIRAANLLWAVYLCAPALDAAFLGRFYQSMFEHGLYIARNLENRAGFHSNHYLANLVGLYYIGALCPQLRPAVRWRRFAAAELEAEIARQVLPDGMDFEASTCYHRLVLEFFFYPALLGRVQGRPFSAAYEQRLRRMFDFTLHVLKPDGRTPQFGDNDSGRLHILAPRHNLDHSYLLQLAALLWQDGAYKLTAELDPEAAWAFGPGAWAGWQALPQRREAMPSRRFPDAGVHVLRRGGDLLYVTCGPNGQAGNGGHAHNDKLSFELVWGGADVIVDPGTYTYTRYPAWRNRFRSTACHNTLQLAGEEQNRFIPDALFALRPDATAVCTEWEPDAGRFSGYHTGYARLGVIHRRTLEWVGGVLRCTDRLEPVPGARPGPLPAAGHLHLAPGVVATPAGPDAVLLQRGGAPLGRLRWLAPVELAVESAHYSPGYGEIEPCQAIAYRWRAEVPSELVWELTKFEPAASEGASLR